MGRIIEAIYENGVLKPIKPLRIWEGKVGIIIVRKSSRFEKRKRALKNWKPIDIGRTISKEEIKHLHHAIRQVLRAAIGDKGASIVNYYRPSGERGTAHFQFKVAHGQGKYCPNCGTPIKRILVRNRGSYLCPKCQPEP